MALNTDLMTAVAGIGLVANVVAAYLHIVSAALVSVAALAGARSWRCSAGELVRPLRTPLAAAFGICGAARSSRHRRPQSLRLACRIDEITKGAVPPRSCYGRDAG